MAKLAEPRTTTKKIAPPSADETEPRAVRSFMVFGALVPAAPLAAGLYVVATPIGNLADVTLRALEIMAGADAILAEDTRVSRTLLQRYRIDTPLTPYHEHNAAEVRPRALSRIAGGEALALISDAGTPLISDPGYRLVAEAATMGLSVNAAPGPSAALAAAPGTLVLYEAPGRLAEALADLAFELGPRPAAVARELTKFHEEVRRGTLDSLAAQYAAEAPPKGEIVVIVGAGEARPPISQDALDREIIEALRNLSVKDASAAVAARHAVPRRQVYARALALAGAAR